MNANTNAANLNDIDSLLDGTLDDLADMPAFKPFPAGAHRVSIKWEMKVVNGNTCPELSMTALETIELANPDDVPLAAKDNTSLLFMFKKSDGTPNEIGQGQFKEVMKSLAAHYGTKSPRELMAESQNAEVLVVTKVRAGKKDANNEVKYYTDLVSLTVM